MNTSTARASQRRVQLRLSLSPSSPLFPLVERLNLGMRGEVILALASSAWAAQLAGGASSEAATLTRSLAVAVVTEPMSRRRRAPRSATPSSSPPADLAMAPADRPASAFWNPAQAFEVGFDD